MLISSYFCFNGKIGSPSSTKVPVEITSATRKTPTVCSSTGLVYEKFDLSKKHIGAT